MRKNTTVKTEATTVTATKAKAPKASKVAQAAPAAPEAPNTKAPKQAKAAWARELGLTTASKINWLVKTNPKRVNSKAYALWEKAAYAKTFGELAANVGSADARLLVSWGVAHGQVTVN